jgi:protein SCO1/2
MRKILLPLFLLAAMALAGCGGPAYSFHGTAYNPIIPAPAIEGLQAGNTQFELKDLPEKVKLVFFGYTFCPDVCPLTLANIKSVYEQLPPYQQKDVAAVFVSVDPERDTPDRLGEYVHSFNPSFYGVQVPPDALETAKQEYGVFAKKHEVDANQSAAGYLIDHTAVIYLIDKDDNLRAIYPTDAPAADITADVQHLLKQ